ncbi:thiamine monophosphate kinase [Neisseria zoodegmatis]|uniref:Thiamine-monophosphate kinase n=1 Tax=Neisseria zoodegmatis TaxID=326523 RepID=A0A378WV27_9NEIS|nr:thiamine-phosphate kinase [Neisseria zoodegmatis]SUA44304.1 thiamine monophosphate kinase [Neisseria zoodegmatis]
MKEFDFIKNYLYRQQKDSNVLLGIGDDAAIVRPRLGWDLCCSSDMLLKDRHFFADVSPADLAYKILAVNISDMAAMGAVPRWALLSAGLPELNPNWLNEFCDSLFTLAKQFGVTLIGGDTTKGDLAFNVTIIGELPQGKALRRDAAQMGDDIWVSGTVGLAAAALNCHWKNIELPDAVFALCEQARLRPKPRVDLGKALLPFAHAAQDISDGLAQDIGHILKASDVGADVFADCVPTLPELRQILDKGVLYDYMLAGGDDYELLFTAPKSCREAVLAAGRVSDTPVTRIGKINDSGRLNLLDSNGHHITLTSLGFDHFG